MVVLSSRSRTLNIGTNQATAPDPADNPNWMRWNNFGIGLLDQLQYADAVNAFGNVVKLRPDYADGYVNIALTEMQWEKYGSAQASIDKARALSPNSPRVLYYAGILERRENHFEKGTEDLQRVVEMAPQCRDAVRELGISYYRQHKYEEAMKQFDALLKIDPDDLSAHYNLSLLYRRMGMMEQATKEQAIFVDLKADPGAPTYSLDYLRLHPEVSAESIPWHVHSDIQTPMTQGAH
jgi:tetratricopeptide (TPR) repeat protein